VIGVREGREDNFLVKKGMKMESMPAEKKSDQLASAFRSMSENGVVDRRLFSALESDLEAAGFALSGTNDVFEKMHDQGLLCRSESFGRVMDAIADGKDIDIENAGDEANMCVMAGGAGFRIAMLEGFSGKDVDGMVKVVISFRKDHLASADPIARDSRLWESKPETSEVSLRGRGRISPEDIEMASFRFPVRFFPEERLTEDEADRLVDGKIGFIVRHYIKTKSRTYHH
jgi:hypothetical protein